MVASFCDCTEAMAASGPSMKRRRASTAAALEKTASTSGAERRTAKPKTAKKTARAQKTDASEERIPKRLYIPAEVDQELRLRAAKEGVQQSEIATEALRLFLGL